MPPVYKMYLGRSTPAWYALSAEEQRDFEEEARAALAAVGGQQVVHCAAEWSNDAWHWFGVESFPNLDAALQYQERLTRLGWQRFVAEITVLGTELTAEFERAVNSSAHAGATLTRRIF